jgi:putative oxidoreductase
MAKKKQNFITHIVKIKLDIIDFFSPFGNLALRLWLAITFWQSGLLKFKSWDSTIFLFEEEYRTHERLTLFGSQIFSAESAAIFATATELILPLLLVVGLAARHAAFGLLVMTYIIEKTYTSIPTEDATFWSHFVLNDNLHIAWAIASVAIILLGAGRFSWDYFVRANYFRFPKTDNEADKLLSAFVTVCLTIFAIYLIVAGFLISS